MLHRESTREREGGVGVGAPSLPLHKTTSHDFSLSYIVASIVTRGCSSQNLGNDFQRVTSASFPIVYSFSVQTARFKGRACRSPARAPQLRSHAFVLFSSPLREEAPLIRPRGSTSRFQSEKLFSPGIKALTSEQPRAPAHFDSTSEASVWEFAAFTGAADRPNGAVCSSRFDLLQFLFI